MPASVPPAAAAGLYVHCPFCAAVCPYCDFAVQAAGRLARLDDLVEGLVREASGHGDRPWSFDTVYLGGGTPSLLAPEQLARLLDGLRGALPVEPSAALFIEVNPEHATPERVAAWRALGFGFVSLGVQSLDDRRLAWLGRRHDAATAVAACGRLLQAGFATVSVDLIYGCPGDDAGTHRRELERVVALAPAHLSCYQLTVHEGTVLGVRRRRGYLVELGEGVQAELFRLGHRLLADAGYAGYEVSSFARAPEHRSRHNRKYWRHEPYLGLGPSAHSFDGSSRWWNLRRFDSWRAAVDEGRPPVAGREKLGPAELALEALMLGLRTTDGVDLEAVRERHDVELAGPNERLLAGLAAAGLVRVEGSRVVPTLDGLAVADGLARAFAVPGLGEGGASGTGTGAGSAGDG